MVLSDDCLKHETHVKYFKMHTVYKAEYIYIRGEFNKFPNVFVYAFKIVVDS